MVYYWLVRMSENKQNGGMNESSMECLEPKPIAKYTDEKTYKLFVLSSRMSEK